MTVHPQDDGSVLTADPKDDSASRRVRTVHPKDDSSVLTADPKDDGMSASVIYSIVSGSLDDVNYTVKCPSFVRLFYNAFMKADC